MKRLLIIGLALAAFGSAGIVHAAGTCDQNSTVTCTTNAQCANDGVTGDTCSAISSNYSGYCDQNSTVACNTNADCANDGVTGDTCSSVSSAASNSGSNTASGASGTGAGQGLNGNPSAAFGWLLGGIMTIFAWLAGTAGVVLNDAIYYTVVQMGSVVNPNNLSAIGVAWRILRDLGNIVLIFGFLAVGISTIIGYNNYGVGKRLPMLLIVAIFINFSLFATEAVIDVGNLFATEFYTQINGGSAPGVEGFSAATQTNGGISGTIMNSLSLQTLYNVGNGTSNNYSGALGGLTALTDSKVMLVGILGTILFIILAFVLFALAIILIARFVALIFLMIVAPIGFAGLVVPGLEKTAGKWWSTLFEQVVTAPALLLMLYVALAVITDAQFLTGFGANGANYTAIASGATSATTLDGYAGLLLAFIVAMGLLLACVVFAKKMGAVGAGAATTWAGKASFGVTAFAGRRTIGRLSNYTSDKIKSSKFGQTDLGRLATVATNYGAKASFDVRGSKAVQSLAKEQKIELGAAQKGGYEAILKKSVKERTDYAKSLQAKEATPAQKAALAAAATAASAAQTQRDADKKAVEDLETKRKGLNYIDPELNTQIEAANKKLAGSQKNLDSATENQAKTASEIAASTWTVKQAQENYAASLDKASGVLKLGTLGNSAGFGAAIGAAHAIPVAAVAGAGIGAATGVGVGLAGMPVYFASAAPAANKKASAAILKEANKSAAKKLGESVAKAIEDAEKEANKESGGDTAEKKEAA